MGKGSKSKTEIQQAPLTPEEMELRTALVTRLKDTFPDAAIARAGALERLGQFTSGQPAPLDPRISMILQGLGPSLFSAPAATFGVGQQLLSGLIDPALLARIPTLEQGAEFTGRTLAEASQPRSSPTTELTDQLRTSLLNRLRGQLNPTPSDSPQPGATTTSQPSGLDLRRIADLEAQIQIARDRGDFATVADLEAQLAAARR